MKIVADNAVARFPEFRFREPLSWVMEPGENWAVVGPNGAGKTLSENAMYRIYGEDGFFAFGKCHRGVAPYPHKLLCTKV